MNDTHFKAKTKLRRGQFVLIPTAALLDHRPASGAHAVRADEGHQDVEMVGLSSRRPGAGYGGGGRLVAARSRRQLGCGWACS